MRNLIIILFVSALLLMGCCDYFLPTTNETQNATSTTSSTYKYKCPDGTMVSNRSACPAKRLTAAGWYSCNNEAKSSPCNDFVAVYCDKFTPTDLTVREAASEAISKHPGEFSINQLLDVYDWVRTNVIYQNVLVNLTYQPYYPNETLRTYSGDCKNQAVLIASMVEAIGGSARVLLIPDCGHAFAEVYLGNGNNTDVLNAAVRAHYPEAKGKTINWHTVTENNNTEIWFIFDTAGGEFPGQTIPECLNASQTFVMHDCSIGNVLNAPTAEGTEFGPDVLANFTKVISDHSWFSHWEQPVDISTKYTWCHYDISLESLSDQMSWYITDETNYNYFRQGGSFRYYCGEENVYDGTCQLDLVKPNKFYTIIENDNDRSITTKVEIVQTCYTN